MNSLGLICARSGSKGLKNKNIKNFCGKPLIYWTIQHFKKIKKVKRIILSTDSKKIASIGEKYGAEVPFLRPKYLSNDNTPEWLVWKHLINHLKKKEKKLPNYILSLPVTSPCRKLTDINKSINFYVKNKFDIVMAVTSSNRNPFFNIVYRKKGGKIFLVNKTNKKIFNRQNAPMTYDLTTVGNIFNPKKILKKNHIFECNVGSITVSNNSAIDIDSEFDFKIAEYVFKKNLNK